MNQKNETIKQWSHTPCGSSDISPEIEKGSLDFFDEVRKSRYEVTDRWMMEKIPFHLGKDKKVLEIGYGMGTDLVTWRLNGADVYGIDITNEHHRLATLNFQLRGKKADLRLADAADIPFASNYFDIVYSNGVLHHTPDTVRCISEAYRVLKPGGLFIFSMYRTYSAFHLFAKLWEEGILRGQLKTLGYKGLLATIEAGADGKEVKPLVKTYCKKQLKHMLADFSKVEFKVGHFKKEHLARLRRLFPRFLEKPLEPYLGWYLISYATK